MPAGSTRRGFLRILTSAGLALFGFVTRAWGGVTGSQQRPIQRPVPPVAGVATAKQTVRLTDAAVQAPLPEKSWLTFFRNFLTRTGSWRGHPTEARMLARRGGRVVVVGAERAPVGDMLGVGTIRDAGDGVVCSTNVCESLGASARTTCTSRSCGKNSCADLQCNTDQCSAQNCSKHSCESHSAAIKDIAGELQANWDSAFVRELREQFGSDSTTALAQAVASFVQRNGYRVR